MNALPEVVNWLVALPLLAMCFIEVFWAFDLIITQVAGTRPWWHVFLRSGSFWLGVRFLIVAIFLFGALGILLLLDPEGTTPAWFGVSMVASAGASIVAWWLLSLSEVSPDDEGDDNHDA